jgi:hypothetical protein
MNALKSVANNVATNWQKSRLQLSRVWALSLPYFQSEEKWRARLLLAAGDPMTDSSLPARPPLRA